MQHNLSQKKQNHFWNKTQPELNLNLILKLSKKLDFNFIILVEL